MKGPNVLTVYGIKSCDSCRNARKYLAEKDIKFEFMICAKTASISRCSSAGVIGSAGNAC